MQKQTQQPLKIDPAIFNIDPDKLTPELIKKVNEWRTEVKKQINLGVQAEKIRFYAESLTVPWNKIEGSDPSWCQTYGKKPPKDSWAFIYEGLVSKPFAHLHQREMTYPVDEYSKLLDVAKAKYHVYFAGNRGGKSVFLANWIAMECMGIHPFQKITWAQLLDLVGPSMKEKEEDLKQLRDHLTKTNRINLTVRPLPPLHWWVASPELPSEADIPRGEDAAIIKKISEWAEPEIKHFYRKDKILVWKSGSVLNFKGYNQEKDAYKSEDVDGIGWDEEPPKPLWDEGMMRLIDRFGIVLLAMTADYSSVWSYQVRQREAANKDYHFATPSGAEDNPFLSQDEVNRTLGSKTGDELMMRAKGLHVQFRGKVFPFERNLNVGKPFEVTNNDTIHVIIDWHPVKAIVTSFLAIDPRNMWYIWDESIQEDHLISVLAQDIQSRLSLPALNLQVRFFIIDQLAKMKIPNEQTKKSESIIDMLRKYHINCKVGNTDFDSAHAWLCQKIKNREFYIDERCPFHIEQFDTWGAKRYQKGYLEGTLRDMLEKDGNDGCINMIYARNAGAKFDPLFDENQPGETFRRPAGVARIYGRRAA